MKKSKIYLLFAVMAVASLLVLEPIIAVRGLYRFQGGLSSGSNSFALPDLEAEAIACVVVYDGSGSLSEANMIVSIETINNGVKPSFDGTVSALRVLSPVKTYNTFVVPPLAVGERAIADVKFYLGYSDTGATLKPVVISDINNRIKESNEKNNINEQVALECERSFLSGEIEPKPKPVEDNKLRLK